MSRSSANIAINSAALRRIRQLTGLGVTDLARAAGLTPSYLSNLEAGRRRAVSPQVFASLCEALQITDRRALMASPQSNAAESEPLRPRPEWAEFIHRLVDQAPPLSPAQINRLAILLSSAPVPEVDAREMPAEVVA